MRLGGMTVVGPMAGEQIAAGALAMQTRMLMARIGSTVVAYPTWNLSVRLAAARFFGSYGGKPARPGRAARTATRLRALCASCRPSTGARRRRGGPGPGPLAAGPHDGPTAVTRSAT
jgi:hypothetical protein